MSMDALEKLRAEALKLSESDRAELARVLVQSLDAPADADAADAWDEEIARRLSAIDSGAARLVDRDEFRKRMQARIGSR